MSKGPYTHFGLIGTGATTKCGIERDPVACAYEGSEKYVNCPKCLKKMADEMKEKGFIRTQV